jgi:hypothetical protein
MGRCFGRLDGKYGNVLEVIQKQLCGSGPDIQRQVATAVFKEMSLKEKKLSVIPQTPFSFENDLLPESQAIATADQISPVEQALQQEVTEA